jgi:hypothetical protein
VGTCPKPRASSNLSLASRPNSPFGSNLLDALSINTTNISRLVRLGRQPLAKGISTFVSYVRRSIPCVAFILPCRHTNDAGALATGCTAVVQARFRLPSIVINQSDDAYTLPAVPHADKLSSDAFPTEAKEEIRTWTPTREENRGGALLKMLLSALMLSRNGGCGLVRRWQRDGRRTPLGAPQRIAARHRRTACAFSEPVKPTKVFRFAAPCAGRACRHFDGAECRLTKRVTPPSGHSCRSTSPVPGSKSPHRRTTVYGKTSAEVAKKLNKALSDREDGFVFDGFLPKPVAPAAESTLRLNGLQ